MTDDDAGGRGKNGDFWMTSAFVNDPLITINLAIMLLKSC